MFIQLLTLEGLEMSVTCGDRKGLRQWPIAHFEVIAVRLSDRAMYIVVHPLLCTFSASLSSPGESHLVVLRPCDHRQVSSSRPNRLEKRKVLWSSRHLTKLICSYPATLVPYFLPNSNERVSTHAVMYTSSFLPRQNGTTCFESN